MNLEGLSGLGSLNAEDAKSQGESKVRDEGKRGKGEGGVRGCRLQVRGWRLVGGGMRNKE